MFKIEGIGYNVKYIRNVVSTKVKKYYIYIFQLRIVDNHSRKDVGGCWKGPKSIVFETLRGTKKDIMNARNIKVLVSENAFMNNLDMIMNIPSITNVR
jgi:hypothetical protein